MTADSNGQSLFTFIIHFQVDNAAAVFFVTPIDAEYMSALTGMFERTKMAQNAGMALPTGGSS